MDIVLVTSVIRPVKDYTIFSPDQRKNQTINTIATVREKIPHAYIVMLEGGYIDESERQMFSKLVDHLFETNITTFLKSPGEGTLLYRYLTSDHFKSLNVRTISKLSGRYYLNHNFNWDSFPIDKIIIKFCDKSWDNLPVYTTRYYRIPINHIQQFVTGLDKYLHSPFVFNTFSDIEHCFYHYDIINREAVYSPNKIGVSGLITGTNELVDD